MGTLSGTVSSLRGQIVDSRWSVGFRVATPRDDRLLRDLLADPSGNVLLMPMDVREMLCDISFREQRRHLAGAHPAAVCEIVVVDGVAVGQVVLDGSHAADSDIRVVDLTVHRDHRRRGIASAVLRQLAAGDRRVVIGVRPDDRPMLALCRQAGFVPCADADEAGMITMRQAMAEQTS